MKKIKLGGLHVLPAFFNESDRVGAKSQILDVFSFPTPNPYDLAKRK